MTGSVNASGLWKEAAPYVKVAGTWKFSPEAWKNVSGEWKNWFLAGGINDSFFATYDAFNGLSSTVSSIAIQPDGKIILGGSFTTFNGASLNNIVRFNSDGTQDTAFTTGTGPTSTVSSIAIQSDGKIILGGIFTSFNGVTVNRIVRLNSDGTRDTAFTTGTGTGANDVVKKVAIQSDGKILVSGLFTTFNGATVNRIVRLNSNGTRDTAFTTGTGTSANSQVSAIDIQSDGKIILGGLFTTFNAVSVGGIVRLNTDGTRDTAFTTNTGTGTGGNEVSAIAIQSDGKIILGGAFTTFNGVTVNRIVRLNSDGTRDTAFTTGTGTGATSTVSSIAIQPDGKIILGGSFTNFNGATVNYIVRLNTDGTQDTAFTTGTGPTSTVSSIAIQPDGKIILGGSFTNFNGATVNRIVRLNTNGTHDTFITIIVGASDTVSSIAIQPDGKIILGGSFSNFNGATVNYIVRLNTDGTQDTAFTTNTGTGASNVVSAIAIQPDGKIILGGSFTTFNGVSVGGIVRLNSDGTRDTAFTTNTGTGASSINTIAIQSDGKIILGGAFTTFNGVTVNRIVRLNSDGTRDTAFTTNTGSGANNPGVSAIAIQSDGKIILGGLFTTFNGATVNRIVRLNSDGTRDTAFTTNTGTGTGISGVSAIAIQPDGKIILGGSFTTFNGVTVRSIVRLNSDGTRDTAFTTNTGSGASSINTIAIQSDGKIILGGSFITFNAVTANYIVRLNSNGTRDTAFTTNTGTGASDIVSAIAIQPDGKIVLGGRFLGFNQVNRTYLVRIGGDLTS